MTEQSQNEAPAVSARDTSISPQEVAPRQRVVAAAWQVVASAEVYVRDDAYADKSVKAAIEEYLNARAALGLAVMLSEARLPVAPACEADGK
jgi:hypothetical protein